LSVDISPVSITFPSKRKERTSGEAMTMRERKKNKKIRQEHRRSDSDVEVNMRATVFLGKIQKRQQKK
jgi:hypothetical protein